MGICHFGLDFAKSTITVPAPLFYSLTDYIAIIKNQSLLLEGINIKAEYTRVPIYHISWDSIIDAKYCGSNT